jgi:hypothetical protein
MVAAKLEEQKIQRNIALTVPSFLGVSSILEATDFLVILPEQLGDRLASSGNVRVFPLPFEMPPYFITQHWHELNGHDPANRWLRGIMADLFLTPEKPVVKPKVPGTIPLMIRAPKNGSLLPAKPANGEALGITGAITDP